jgi:DNA polymerase-3 subunit delta
MPTSAYLICGEDEFLVSAKARELLDKWVPPEDRAFGLETLDGRASTMDEALLVLRKCDEALRTVGFMANSKVVWLNGVNFLQDNVVGRTDTVKEAAAEFARSLKSLPPGQTLIVTAGKVDKRFAFFKAFKEVGEIHAYDLPEKVHQADASAREHLGEILAQAGLKMASEVAGFFIQKVGTDTRQIVNEVEKLGLYLGDRREITVTDIQAITSASRSAIVWDLADQTAGRDLQGALGVLRQLLFQKESPIGLLIGLQGRWRELLIYREAMDRKWFQMQGRNGAWLELPPEAEKVFAEDFRKDPRDTHPYRAGLLAQQAARFTSRELMDGYLATIQTQQQMVSGSTPEALLMELLILKLVGVHGRK